MVNLKLKNINFENSDFFLSELSFCENSINCILSQNKNILSELFRVLLFLDKSQVGRYTLNGIDISMFSCRDLRKKFATVLYNDDFKFFRGTVEDYIKQYIFDIQLEEHLTASEFSEELTKIKLDKAPPLSDIIKKNCNNLSITDKLVVKSIENIVKQSGLFIIFIDDTELNEDYVARYSWILKDTLTSDCCIVILSQNFCWESRADYTIKL